jgi:hypothetical protein
MFGLIHEAAEAVLGPWALVAGAIVGAVWLTRRRGGAEAGAAPQARSRGGVPERARTAVARAGEWWSDLVAESRAEWEAGRAAPAAAAGAAAARPRSVERPTTRRTGAGRGRDARGRFTRGAEN